AVALGSAAAFFVFTFLFFTHAYIIYIKVSRFHESSKMKIIDKNKARENSNQHKSLLTTVTTATTKYISISYKHALSM
ncbi:MAG: hypothetical protein K5675_04580, partial [Lachnospiraceae bacterium]|nr:hypothetical protein [Lachnospiraceae bacterium]